MIHCSSSALWANVQGRGAWVTPAGKSSHPQTVSALLLGIFLIYVIHSNLFMARFWLDFAKSEFIVLPPLVSVLYAKEQIYCKKVYAVEIR
jgi:hypothetical protein